MSIATGDDPIMLPLTLFLCQLMLIVGMCKIMSYICKFIKQPTVIAEVVTGIILGPSVLGLEPKYMTRMFPATSMTIIQVIANIGLILFMFLVGLELDAELLRRNYKQSLAISLTAMILPFGLGSASSLAVYHALADTKHVTFGNFLLFIGVALSITAFPVLARILTEYGMLQTKIGTTVMSAAAVDDVTAWVILALVVAIARSTTPLDCLYTFLMLIGFLIFMFGAAKPALRWFARRTCKNNTVAPPMVIILFLMIFMFSWFTEIIGVHAIFGGFVVGVITPREGNLTGALTERFEDIVVVLLLPLYFTFSGLRTKLGTLNTGVAWGCLMLVTVAACVGKVVGATAAARFLKHSWRESVTIGILMNTKGLVELIVLNIGLDVGVLDTRTFTVFVVMALITTFMTTPLLHFVWLRHQRKSPKDNKEGKLYLNLYTGDSETGANLTTIAKVLVAGASSYKAKVIQVLEVSDRPSSYLSLINNFNSGVAKVATPPALQLAQERAKRLGLDIKSRLLSGSETAVTIEEHAYATGADMVVLQWDVQHSPTTPGRIVQHVLTQSQTFGVSVLADKGFSKTMEVKNIHVAFCGFEFERGVLFLIRQLLEKHHDVKILVLATSQALPFVQAIASGPRLRIVENATPFDAITEIKDDTPDLVMVGVDDAWHKSTTNEYLDLVGRSGTSVLLVRGSTDITHGPQQLEVSDRQTFTALP